MDFLTFLALLIFAFNLLNTFWATSSCKSWPFFSSRLPWRTQQQFHFSFLIWASISFPEFCAKYFWHILALLVSKLLIRPRNGPLLAFIIPEKLTPKSLFGLSSVSILLNWDLYTSRRSNPIKTAFSSSTQLWDLKILVNAQPHRSCHQTCCGSATQSSARCVHTRRIWCARETSPDVSMPRPLGPSVYAFQTIFVTTVCNSSKLFS